MRHPLILADSHFTRCFLAAGRSQIIGVMAAVEGMRVSLGPVKVLQYVMQGLYHPARKVRDVYWKVYNTLYIGGQDALVVGYPRIPNDAKNSYARYELDYVL